MSWKQTLASRGRLDHLDAVDPVVEQEPAASGIAAGLDRDAPLVPQIKPRLDRAIARRDALVTEAAGLALDVELGDGVAIERQRVVAGDLAKAEGEVVRLQAALETADSRDTAADNDATMRTMRAGLAELEGVCAARAKAAADVDAAIAAAVGAWVRLRASTELIRMSIPRGCSLPRGFVDLDLRRLVAGAMWKHSGVGNPGDEHAAFPGAAAPSISTNYNARAIENVADAVGAQNHFVVSNTRRQIEVAAKFYAGEIGEVA
jgi:hypothetical protein